MEERLTFKVQAFDGRAQIAVAVKLADGRRFAVAQPREVFNRHECKDALKAWVAEHQAETTCV